METKTTEGLYFVLFDQVTKAVEELEKSEVLPPNAVEAMKILKNAQKTTDEMYVNSLTKNKGE